MNVIRFIYLPAIEEIVFKYHEEEPFILQDCGYCNLLIHPDSVDRLNRHLEVIIGSDKREGYWRFTKGGPFKDPVPDYGGRYTPRSRY